MVKENTMDLIPLDIIFDTVPCDTSVGNVDQRPVWLLGKKIKIESTLHCCRSRAGREVGIPVGTILRGPQEEDGQLRGVVISVEGAGLDGSTGTGDTDVRKHARKADQGEWAGLQAGGSM